MIEAAVIVIVGLIGIGLLVRGIRGQRRGDEPHCRQCDYNLFGLDQETQHFCPECGADLFAPLSVRFGRRVRSKRLTIVGSTLVTVAILVGGALIWQGATGYDWIRITPTSWLIHDGDEPFQGRRARFELLRRFQNGELSDSDIASIVKHGTPAANAPFEPKHLQWAELIETAWAKGKLSNGELERYSYRFFEASARVVVRPRVRLGQPMTIQLDMYPRGFGSRWRSNRNPAGSPLETRYQVLKVTVDGKPSDLIAWMPGLVLPGLVSPGLDPTGRAISPPDKRVNLEAGEHTLEFAIRFGVARTSGASPRPLPTNETWPPQLFEWKTTIEVPFSVIAADAPPPPIVDDEAVRREVARAIDFIRCTASYVDGAWKPLSASGISSLSDLLDGKPQLAYDIVWRSGDQEWIAGAIYSDHGQLTRGWPVPMISGLDETLEKIDIILRPNPHVAEIWTTDGGPILGGEIVYENIPIRIDRQE